MCTHLTTHSATIIISEHKTKLNNCMEKHLPNNLGTLFSDYSNTKLTQKVNSFLIYLQ